MTVGEPVLVLSEEARTGQLYVRALRGLGEGREFVVHIPPFRGLLGLGRGRLAVVVTGHSGGLLWCEQVVDRLVVRGCRIVTDDLDRLYRLAGCYWWGTTCSKSGRLNFGQFRNFGTFDGLCSNGHGSGSDAGHHSGRT